MSSEDVVLEWRRAKRRGHANAYHILAEQVYKHIKMPHHLYPNKVERFGLEIQSLRVHLLATPVTGPRSSAQRNPLLVWLALLGLVLLRSSSSSTSLSLVGW